jgi:hypothetical protein
VEGEGSGIAEGEGLISAEGEGRTNVEGEGSGIAEEEGFTSEEGEGRGTVDGDGWASVEGTGVGAIEGEGLGSIEGEGLGSIEGEGIDRQIPSKTLKYAVALHLYWKVPGIDAFAQEYGNIRSAWFDTTIGPGTRQTQSPTSCTNTVPFTKELQERGGYGHVIVLGTGAHRWKGGMVAPCTRTIQSVGAH